MIEKSHINKTARSLVRTKDKLRFDLAVQRNEVWDIKRKSLFIHSLLYGYPFPPCYALDQGDNNLWLLDGKQRITTTIAYLEDGFQLSRDTPEVGTYDIGGKFFSELPEELQDELNSTNFTIYCMRGMTDDEVDEMFLRLNNGMALTKMELTRAMAKSHIMEFVNKVSDTPFFSEAISITGKQRNRFTDQEIILHITSLVYYNRPVSLSSRDIQEFVLDIRDVGVGELEDSIYKTAMYLSQAFPVKEKFLKKIHIPMLFLVASRAMEEGVEPTKFAGWAKGFFVERYDTESDYALACKAGSAKKDNVTIRIEEMTRDYEEHIETAIHYVASEDVVIKKETEIKEPVNSEVEDNTEDITEKTLQLA